MKVFVVGGSGRVATELIKNLVARGHDVIAGARHPDQIMSDPHVRAVALDLHAEVPEIREIIGKVDAIYFVAGSRGKDLLQTDAFGAVKTMWAAEQNEIHRYLMLSSMSSTEPENWSREGLKQLMDYNVAKFFADNYLIHETTLDYTILQPTSLTEEPATGKISVGTNQVATNPIPDVAETLAELLEAPNTIHQTIAMCSGETPIAEAIKKI